MFRILQSLFKNEERNTLKINLFGLTSLKTKVLFMVSNFYNTKSYSTNLLLQIGIYGKFFMERYLDSYSDINLLHPVQQWFPFWFHKKII